MLKVTGVSSLLLSCDYDPKGSLSATQKSPVINGQGTEPEINGQGTEPVINGQGTEVSGLYDQTFFTLP